MPERIGFTGTQKGLSPSQGKQVINILSLYIEKGAEFHHGDCIGADAQAHEIARRLGYKIVIHPPDDPRKRAWCEGDEWKEEKPYLVRNENIVLNCTFLIACPKENQEVLRSGTWATIRKAKKRMRRVRTIWR